MTRKVEKSLLWHKLVPAVAALWLLVPATAGLAVTNGKIAFQTNTHNTTQIYTMNPDGGDKTRVAAHVGFNDRSPSFSPDGLRITFGSDLAGADPSYDEIFTMGIDGAGLSRLTFNAVTDSDPQYSPDGTKVAYTCRVGGGGLSNMEICTVEAGGGVPVPLTSDISKRNQHPSFSPDGQTIIYSHEEAVGDFDIWAMDANGNNERLLLDRNGHDEGASYSPDGSRIVYFSDAGGVYNDNEIYTMAANGTDVRPLTDNNTADTNPTYSPDGTRIAFDTQRNRGELSVSDIYTMDTNGKNLAQLTSGSADEQHPTWAAAPDGTMPVTPPGSGGKLSISCTSPKVKAGKKKTMSKKRLARHLKKGIKCYIKNSTGVTALGAAIVRGKKVKKKNKTGKKAFVSKKKGKKKTTTRCYRIDKPRVRVKCRSTKSNGLVLKADSKSGAVRITYRPLARKRKGKVRHSKSARRMLNRMAKGRVLRYGTYRLTFVAHVQTQSNPKKTKKKTFKFTLRVKKKKAKRK